MNNWPRDALFCVALVQRPLKAKISNPRFHGPSILRYLLTQGHFVERFRRVIPNFYSIVKDSSADMGVNFNIVQNRPTIKAVCTISIFFKILTKYLFGNTFYIPERKQRDIILDI